MSTRPAGSAAIAAITRLRVRRACAAIQARRIVAVAERRLAIGATEAGRTDARVRALAGVEAGAAVLARPMVRAVVKVLIAEQATPALHAAARPRDRAGAVHAARIGFAFVTIGALPAQLTSVLCDENIENRKKRVTFLCRQTRAAAQMALHEFAC